MNYSCEFLVKKYLKCKEKNNLNECRLYFDLLKYCIYKGSITFDGVSLTISKIDSCLIEVSIIPYTLANTTLGFKSVGDYVNVETDMIAKYVARQMDFKK